MPGYALRVAPARAVEAPLWRQLAAAPSPASVAELHLATRAHPNAIQHRLDRWVRAGLVTRIEGSPKRFAMNDDTPRTPRPPRVAIDGRAAPRAPTQRQRLWRAMRVLPSFDIPGLMLTAAVTGRSAVTTVNQLLRAGYLRKVGRGNGASGAWSTYRLVRDTGPVAPVVNAQRGTLTDGNTGRVTDIAPGAVSLRSRRAAAVADGGVS